MGTIDVARDGVGTDSPERFDPSKDNGTLMASEHLLRYLWASRVVESKTVLDAGCGTGYGSRLLARAGAARVVGVDVSADALAEARAGGSDGVEFTKGDIRELPFADAEFDVVTCFEVIEHVEKPGTALAELKRVLGPNGLLLVSSPNRATYPPGNPHHVREYLPEELRAEVAEHFSNVDLYRQDALLASAVQPRGDSGAGGPTLLTAQVAHELEEGAEAFVIAVASDAPPAAVPAQALLGEPFEVSWWQEQQSEKAAEVQRVRAAAEAEMTAAVEAVRAEVDERLAHEVARLRAAAERDLEEARRRTREAANALIAVEAQRAREFEELRAARAAREELERMHDDAQRTIQEIQRTRVWRVGTFYWRVRDGILRRNRT